MNLHFFIAPAYKPQLVSQVQFFRRIFQESVVAREQQAGFDRPVWQQCDDFGIRGLPFAESSGGATADILTTMLVMEGLDYSGKKNGLPFALNAQMWRHSGIASAGCSA